MITRLPGTVGPTEGDPPPGLAAGHPMRAVTEVVAFDPAGWTDDRRREVIELFDALADEWSSRDVPGREAPILDALDRGLAAAPGAARARAVEVGAGDGLNTRHLAPHFPTLVVVDISAEMLVRARDRGVVPVLADASSLPVADGSVDVAILVNMFLFPAELERVVASDGVVVWVSSRGEGTPIYLSADDVDRALPGSWDGVASTAGWGTWSVHWRTPA